MPAGVERGFAKAERRLRADHDIFAPHRLDRRSEHRLGAVSRRGVEEIDAELQSLVDYPDRIGFALALRQPPLAEPAAAEPGNADVEIGAA